MIDGAPETTVPCPPIEDFGINVPALLTYNAAGECVHAVYGADIQPFLEWVGTRESSERLHFKLVSS